MAEARHPDLRARNTHVTCHQQHVTHDARHPHLPATQATHHQKGGACVQMRAGGDVRGCAWGMRAAEGGLGVCLACACVSHCACAPQGAFLSSRACVLSRVCALVVGLAFLSSRGALQVPSTPTPTPSIYRHARTGTQDLRARALDSGVGLNHVVSDHQVLLDQMPAART